MPITRTRSKYYVLSVLGALVVALVVLAVAPSAQAQSEIDPNIDKECTPNPVQIGQQITCTIDVVAAPGTSAFGSPPLEEPIVVTDTFPAGLTVTGAIGQLFLDGEPFFEPGFTASCQVSDNTVRCEISPFLDNTEGKSLSFRATVEAIAEQCGTFQNTATATGVVFSAVEQDFFPFTVSDTEQITVEGCEVPPGQQPNQQQGSPAPITQDFEQDSEAGEIDQSFDIS